MRKFYIIAAAAIAVLSACTREEAETKQEKFSATIEQITKTYLGEDGLSVLWNEGDEISINGVSYWADQDGDFTTFSPDGDEADGTNGYAAIYPSSLAYSNFPSSQNYEEGRISNLPMYATSSDKTLKFKSICAVLAVTICNDDSFSINQLNSIEISSSNHAMSGEFTLEEGQDGSYSLVLKNDDPKNRVRLVCTTYIPENSSKTFYIAIPANTYQDLDISVMDEFGNQYEMRSKSEKDIEVATGTIYPIRFKPQEQSAMAEDYFCISNIGDEDDDNNVRFIFHPSNGADFYELKDQGLIPSLEYCYIDEFTDGCDWNECPVTPTDDFSGFSLRAGRSAYVRAKEEVKTFGAIGDDATSSGYITISLGTGKFEVSGNIMSLLNGNDIPTEFTDDNKYAFADLFNGNSNLVNARHLKLPAATLVEGCYAEMFNNCKNLQAVTMSATDVSAKQCLTNWLKSAGANVETPKLYVDESMVDNETIIARKFNFTIVGM